MKYTMIVLRYISVSCLGGVLIKSNRAGEKVAVLSGEMAYNAFHPKKLPPTPKVEMNDEINGLISKTNREIGRLEGMSEQIPNVELFVSMYVRKEALLSSQIEGTQATLDDILDPELEDNANLEVKDVINYIKATEVAVKRLEKMPLCNRFLKEVHLSLMDGVRGAEKNTGEFRRSQNWIGPQGGNLKAAIFVPPPINVMETAMYELEEFLKTDDELDYLVKIGLIHYQFETIHPFLDGNGRIGRMLITLWLIEKKILNKPILYISYFFKRNRVEYYDRLMDVRTKGHFEGWIKFFLQGMFEAAADACDTINELSKLHKKNDKVVKGLKSRTDTYTRLFNYIERSPIVDISRTAKALELQYNTVSSAIKKFVEIGILKETTLKKKNRRFAYIEYLEYLRKDTELY